MTDAEDTSGRVGLVGKTLGRYRLQAELGRGGMATVYRAFDPQLARDVAVKVIHGVFTGRGDIERRFHREAQAVAGLKHEAIVAVFDFAPGGDGEPAYIVSELVDGPTLRQLLERAGGRLIPEIATLVGARVAAALGAAHAGGIVHRDVKPDNVMVDGAGAGSGAAGGGAGAAAARARPPVRVLLTDFGIARLIEDDTMTATGSILGSPAYMSPEQARGGDIGPQSDVFSLGVLLYQLATGRTPFGGKDPLTVIAAILTGEFLRPGRVEARVSPDLEAVILRCLRRAPAERYADGSAVRAALEAVLARSPIAEDPAALRRFLDDRAGFEREVGARVADEAVAAARGCLRRGELSRALAAVSRALAYVPGHGAAEALLATISSRRRWGKIALVAGGVLALAGGGTAAVRAVRARWAAAPPPAAAVAAAPAPVAPATAGGAAPVALAPSGATVASGAAAAVPAAPPARAPGTPTAEPSGAPAAAAAPATTGKASPASAAAAPKRRGGGRRREAAGDETRPPAEPVAIAVAPAPPIATPAPPPAAPPPPAPAAATPVPAPAAPVATAGLTLRASYGFCSPSLDERPPAVRPVYTAIPAGAHRIYCTLPGGERTLVGTYELRAGTHPNLVVVQGSDGKPSLGKSE